MSDFALTTDWQAALLNYAQYYAAQVEKDYRTFCSAFDGGSFSFKEHSTVFKKLRRYVKMYAWSLCIHRNNSAN